MNTALSQTLRTTLNHDIAQMMPENHEGASAVLARRRLQAVADNAPLLLIALAEPWWKEDIKATLIHCARIHLYARILDDALDENLLIHRLLLLRAQPLFWSSVGELAIVHPQHWQQSTQLIHETITAVEQDDNRAKTCVWGTKNHHLLLIPLLLSHDSEVWQHGKTALSKLIWLMQTGDEWRQGALKTLELKHQVLAEVEHILNTETPQLLSQGGWCWAAERMLWESRQLLNSLAN